MEAVFLGRYVNQVPFYNKRYTNVVPSLSKWHTGSGCSNTIHWINHCPADSVVYFVNTDAIHWIVIYPVDSVIQPLKNWGQKVKGLDVGAEPP